MVSSGRLISISALFTAPVLSAALAMRRSTSTLLVATRKDEASMNIFNALRSLPVWREQPKVNTAANGESVDDDVTLTTCNKKGEMFHLWLQGSPLLSLDYANEVFSSKYPQLASSSSSSASSSSVFSSIDDIIFLSKHSAASGTRALTVHPIGIPWLTSKDEEQYGGKSGKCVPPHSHISHLYRKVLAEVKSIDMTEKYQVTLEGTHHGPYAEVPCCFVEIGSTENDWGEEEAGAIWAKSLSEHFEFQMIDVTSETDETEISTNSEQSPSVLGKTYVIMTIGGGHYIPKLNDVARLGEEFYVGHALSSYMFAHYADNPDASPLLEGGWKAIVDEGIDSTMKGAMVSPDTELMVLVDKKAFKAPLKNAITKHLTDRGVNWTFSVSDIKKLQKEGAGLHV